MAFFRTRFFLGGIVLLLGAGGLFLLTKGPFSFKEKSSPTVLMIDDERYTFEDILTYAQEHLPSHVLREKSWTEKELVSLQLEDFIISHLASLEMKKNTKGVPVRVVKNHVLLNALPPDSELRKLILSSISTNASYLQTLTKDISLTEEEILGYYETHTQEFMRKKRIRFAQIVFEKEENARQVYHQILISPDVFDYYISVRQSTRASWESTGLISGSVGPLEFDQLPDFLRVILEKLKPGEISKPVKVGSQFLIYKVLEILPEGTAPFEEVRKEIAEKLFYEKMEQALQRWLKRLFQRHTIIIHWKNLGLQWEDITWKWLSRDFRPILSGDMKNG